MPKAFSKLPQINILLLSQLDKPKMDNQNIAHKGNTQMQAITGFQKCQVADLDQNSHGG